MTHLSETLVIINSPVSDKLHLRNTRDSLEIRMENRLLRAARFVVSMAVALRAGVECLSHDESTCKTQYIEAYLGQLVLLLGR